jgi:hypothetical protein
MTDDTETSSSSLGFKQLDDTNYTIWLPRMTGVLKRKKLFEYADGTEPKPYADHTVSYPDTAQGKADKLKAERLLEKELREYKKNDGAAAAIIAQGLTDAQMHHIEHCTSAHETWTKIKAAHEKEGGLQQALLHIHTITNSKMAEGTKVQDHVTGILTAHGQLVANKATFRFQENLLAAVAHELLPRVLRRRQDDSGAAQGRGLHRRRDQVGHVE